MTKVRGTKRWGSYLSAIPKSPDAITRYLSPERIAQIERSPALKIYEELISASESEDKSYYDKMPASERKVAL